MICQHTKIETRVRADTGAPCGLWACADCGVRFEPLAPPTPTIPMQTLTRDDTQHGQEYVLKSEADAAIARARAGALEEAIDAITKSGYVGTANEYAGVIRAMAAGVR